MLPDTSLPVEESMPSLRLALASNGSAVLVAPPGSGKTTIVPLRLLEEAVGVPLELEWLEKQKGDVPDTHAGDVGDGVVGAGFTWADDDSKVPGMGTDI